MTIEAFIEVYHVYATYIQLLLQRAIYNLALPLYTKAATAKIGTNFSKAV